jgi:hypothetical protein
MRRLEVTLEFRLVGLSGLEDGYWWSAITVERKDFSVYASCAIVSIAIDRLVRYLLRRLWFIADLAFFIGAGLGNASPAASPMMSWTSLLLAMMAYEGS